MQYRNLDVIDAEMIAVRKIWRDTFRDSHTAGPLLSAEYTRAYTATIENITNRPHNKTIIAYPPGVENFFVGFISVDVYEDVPRLPQPVVHYVFVKDGYRDAKLANELLEKAGVDPTKPFLYTFMTLSGRAMMFGPSQSSRRSSSQKRGPRRHFPWEGRYNRRWSTATWSASCAGCTV